MTRNQRTRQQLRRVHALVCEGKESYTTWGAAERAAKRTRRHTGAPVMPYHCTQCKKFHAGNDGSKRM